VNLLSAHGLYKAYGATNLLDDVSLSIEATERLGLVGDNGSGKSTLARIIGGLETPDRGEISSRRGLRVTTLTQVPDLDPQITAFEAAMLGLADWRRATDEHAEISAQLQGSLPPKDGELQRLLDRQAAVSAQIEQLGGWDQEHQVRAMLDHLHVPDQQTLTKNLSGGEQRRIALAKALLTRPDLLILDEPTNHLDTETIDWLEGYLHGEHRGAILLVTHDRAFLDRLVTRTLELSHGKLTSYDGGWESYLSGKAERLAHEQRTEANRQNFLRREIEWLRRQPKARTTKQNARLARAAEALAENAPTAERAVQLNLESTRQGSTVLELRHVSVRRGERRLIDDINLIIKPKQRIGIVGRNGSGKTSLLRVITEELPLQAGELVVGKNTKIAYFDQNRSELDEELTVAENVTDAPSVSVGDQQMSLYSYLARFSFGSSELNKKVGMLSGGERARVALAKLLLQDTNLLLLDEPTNDLDVSTLGALELLLTSFGGSVLVVTHDRYFLNRVATDILSFEGDGKVVHTVGNYDTYQRLRAERVRSARSEARDRNETLSRDDAERPPPGSQRASGRPGGRPQKLSYKEQRELDGLMDLVGRLETRVAELEAEISDPSLYQTRPQAAAELQKDLDSVRAELESKFERWELLESKREAYERGS
jgi:ATP-binding cassette subfamily F protein uup